MPYGDKFDAEDYLRMAAELEAMSDLIARHPEKNHNTSARLNTLAAEMRVDALSPLLKSEMRRPVTAQ